MHESRLGRVERYIRPFGTFWQRFRLGRYGPYIGSRDNEDVSTFASSGKDDTDPRDLSGAYAAIRAYAAKLYGGGVVFNAGATGTGGDWSLTFTRPSTGMTENVTVVWPSDTPSNGDVLTVLSYAPGLIELEWAAGGGGQVDSIVAGDGIDVDATDPVNPIVEVKISADAGNQISFGSDDGLFASGGGGGAPYITGIAPDGDEADPWSWSPTLNNPGSTALWEVTDGSLPGGASINSSTGVCSASALTGNGDISFEVAATITSGTGAGASCYSRQKVSIAPAGLLWDASASNSNFVFTNGGSDAQNSYSFWCTAIGNIGKASGKHQFEIHCISGSASNVFAGVADKTNAATWLLSNVYLGSNSGAYVESVGYWGNGTLYYALSSGISSTSGLASWASGDVITITLDLTVPEVKLYKNGVLATTRAIPAGKTWYPGTSIQGGLAAKTRLVGSGLTYPQGGFTDWT